MIITDDRDNNNNNNDDDENNKNALAQTLMSPKILTFLIDVKALTPLLVNVLRAARWQTAVINSKVSFAQARDGQGKGIVRSLLAYLVTLIHWRI